jgi:hypothetical protein
MAAALDILENQIDAAEESRAHRDQRAANTVPSLRANLRSKGPMIMGAAGAALAFEADITARRKVPKDRRARPGRSVRGSGRMDHTCQRSVRRPLQRQCAGGCCHGQKCQESSASAATLIWTVSSVAV